MLEKIDSDKIRFVSSGIENVQLRMTLSSISDGNTECELWSDEKEETYFLWDKGNIVFYVFGKSPSSEFIADLSELFEDVIEEKAEEHGFSHFKVNNLTDISDQVIKSVFGDREFKNLEKYFYKYNKEEIGEFESSLDELRVIDIDEQFLKSTELRNLARVINEVKWIWPYFRKYYENGFGKAGLVGNEIVCWCTSEYVSKGACGVGIETLDRYRQKGIATETAAEFVDYCLKNDITPYWECGAYNEPSVKLAEKLGFKKIDEYKVLLAKF
ncbi:MAG: GNAT family N-acetyltransferase [Thermoplasmata archaeon]